uniref:Uncharacterized protein n=1 Tax=Globodera rostochiensis TaxID=31243 RepID=A0A914I884_GLORO
MSTVGIRDVVEHINVAGKDVSSVQAFKVGVCLGSWVVGRWTKHSLSIAGDVANASALKKLLQLVIRVIGSQTIGWKNGVVHPLTLFFGRKVIMLLHGSCHCTSQASLSSFLRHCVTFVQLRFAVVVAKAFKKKRGFEF